MSQDIAPLMGLILAGGRSRRFGRDKASFRPIPDGPTLAGRIHHLMAPFCRTCYLSVRPGQYFAEFPVPGLSSIEDQFGDCGPMGGLLSAWEIHPQASWMVVACDLVSLDPDSLRLLLEARDRKRMATAFVHSEDDLPEPLCAIYEPEARQPLREHFDKGNFSLRDFLRTHLPPEEGVRPLRRAVLFNANHPITNLDLDAGS